MIKVDIHRMIYSSVPHSVKAHRLGQEREPKSHQWDQVLETEYSRWRSRMQELERELVGDEWSTSGEVVVVEAVLVLVL